MSCFPWGDLVTVVRKVAFFCVMLFEFEKHDIFRCGDSIIRQGGNLGRA